jgi:hypothetical protein
VEFAGAFARAEPASGLVASAAPIIPCFLSDPPAARAEILALAVSNWHKAL